jgi:hypothetical protein
MREKKSHLKFANSFFGAFVGQCCWSLLLKLSKTVELSEIWRFPTSTGAFIARTS